MTLEVFLDGRWDADGDPVNTAVHLATVAAVQSHILFLRTAILDDPGDAEGCVTCSVTTAVAGTTHDGPVQVDDLRADPGIGAQVVTFSLCILRGELAITAGSGSWRLRSLRTCCNAANTSGAEIAGAFGVSTAGATQRHWRRITLGAQRRQR